MAQPDNFSLYQPLVAGALWLAARGLERPTPRSFVARRAAGRARDAVAERRPARRCATLGLVFVWDRWRAWRSGGQRGRPAIPSGRPSAAVGLFVAGHGAVVGRASSRSSARSRRRPRRARSCSSAHRGVEQHHDAGDARAPARPGRRAARSRAGSAGSIAAVDDLHDARRAAFVLVPFMVIGALGAAALGRLRAVLRLRRDPVRVLGARVGGPRPGRHVHPLGGRPGAARYILALEGIVVASRWIAARRRGWDREPATRLFVGGARSASRSCCAVVGALVRPRRAGTPSGATRRRGRRGARRGRGAAGRDRRHVDRRGRLRATGPGHGGVVLVNDPLDTIEEVAARLRHRLAGPRARRRRRRARARSSTARPAAPGSGSATPILAERPTSCADPAAARLSRCAGDADDAGRESRPVRRSGSSSSRSSSASSSRRRSSSRSPRTPPTTSASPATCSRAAASSPTRCGATARRRSTFPRPAFEVWLPLPTFLAAIPMALLGADVRGRPGGLGRSSARSCRSSPGGSAADVATERGLPLGRRADAGARGRADDARSTCRSSSTPPCPTRRCRSPSLALGACLLMTAHRCAMPRGAPADRPAAHRAGRR